MDVVQEIAVWAKKLPSWQSDALRRIFTSDKLSVQDEDELFDMLLVAHKLPGAKPSRPAPIPFSEIVHESTAPSRKVILRELHSISGVNALVPDQSITFALDGLTVIYGENGAGKSGYARVLKHACHAREKASPILSDVGQKMRVKPSATIEISVDEEDLAVRWEAGCPPSDVLAQIAVFDSHCARVFIDDANETFYLPYGLDVFSRLAMLCKSLKSRITALLAVIPPQLSIVSEFTPTTNAGAYVSHLTASSDLAQLDILSHWDDSRLKRLNELRIVVRDATANSLQQRAAQLRRAKTRFEQLAEKVSAITAFFSQQSVDNIRKLAEAACLAAKAAQFASTQVFADIPIPQIGNDPWRALFDAAREFSLQIVYPGEEFPVTREGAACVLCQQPLSATAAQRLRRFQEFIVNDAARKKDDADAAIQRAIEAIAAVDVDYLVENETLLGEVQEHNANLAANLAEFFKCATRYKQALAQAIKTLSWDSLPEAPVFNHEALTKVAATLELQAAEHEKADNPDELRRLQKELAELEDRERLFKYSNDVRTFVENKKTEAALRKCEIALNTAGITKFGSELMEAVITEQLTHALDQELSYFDLPCIRPQVHKSGERGKIKHKLSIHANNRSSEILSEGEQRVVAIAAFLAELSTCPTRSPIIFDDPVSSLDHMYWERVAKRLVAEARNREVVVFTHDIVMLLALKDECARQQVAFLQHTIRRSAQGPGECPPDQACPWHAMRTKERIGFLKQELAQLRKLSNQSQQDYERIGAELYGKLREAWERAVEEVLLRDVVQRFRPSVETERLKELSTETTDYPTIHSEMSKCSKWFTGHDSAGAIASSFPLPNEIEQDITTLEDFVDVLKKRAETARKNAKAQTEAPAATVSTNRALKVIELAASAASIVR